MPEGPGRVLVIEDEAILRFFLSSAPIEDGFEVRTAANGHEALDVLQAWRPVLILLDLRMPEMDGPSFRAAQRRIPSLADIPVLLLSADDDPERQAATLEVAGCVAKPCDLDELVRAVNRLVAV
jgi:two-component system, chemotaxis family, chemotaxis protein CheY